MSTYTEYHKTYYLKNKKPVQPQQLPTEDFIQLMIWNAKHRAKKLNVCFEINVQNIYIPPKCKYLDIPLTTIRGKGKLDTNASLDRIDSTKGYTPDNVEVISFLANRMKNNATIEQLKTFAKNIDKIYGWVYNYN